MLDAGCYTENVSGVREVRRSIMKRLLFLVLSIVAVVASLHVWRTQQIYELFRFLAFESLVLLIVWNTRRWFREPFSISQRVSWIILAASTALADHGPCKMLLLYTLR